MVTCSVNLLVDACNQGDIETVREFLNEGRIDSLTEEGESLLSAACSAGCFFLVEMILDMGADIEDRGQKDTTPLMEAANSGHSDIVKLLIERNASINAQTGQGNTPLILASANGHTECVKLLLDAGATTEEHNESGHTALMEAASNGHVNVAKLLISYGASINTHSHEFKESALTLACYKGQLDMVKFLLDAGADQEHKTEEMHTALMEASMDGHVEVARLLLDSGAQVTMPADSFESPLTLAACGGHVELAMLLLERGANIEEVNDEGYTPLMEAAREGHEEMVALLLSQGAEINAQTEETSETALTLACCGGFTEVVDFLIKAGADISAGANTPLMEAAQEGHLELVKYLISNAGAEINTATSSGDTALTYACDNGHTDVAEVLVSAGANIEQEADGGRTPLMKACRSGHASTVEFLISRGANVNKVSTNCDQTPLSLACSHGHLEVVEILLAHGADPTHRLRDSSTMLIEAAKGGHTNIVQLLIDYPGSLQSSPMNAMHATTNGNVCTSSTSTGTPTTTSTTSSTPTANNTTTIHTLTTTTTTYNNNNNNTNNHSSVSTSNLITNSNNFPNTNNPNCINLSSTHQTAIRSKAKVIGKSPKSLTRHGRQHQVPSNINEISAQTNQPNLDQQQQLNSGLPSAQQHQNQAVTITTQQQQHHVPQSTGDVASTSVLSPASWYPPIEVDSQTDSNHDTALTVACSNGHEDLVQLLLNRGPDVEHRDKKGFTSLMLAATAGHAKIVEILLNKHADLEAQSERTKDTALSLACSSGRYEVVEILLARGANKEHRNVSDYTPLSLAASGGYVQIIKLLLTHGAEINSRTGSKLGISPLMLAAMNGHAATVKLLLDMGSDINAQIETNRNTALTLACFQGRVDVVSLLLDRKANAEHRAKTGLTPLMEAASGGFVDVGRVLLDKGADVNAPPVPSSRDTALTIAADKGHCKFVELLLSRGAAFDVKNKKGNSPLWLACNGGHLEVVSLLIQAGADVDSQDNRKISCLMAGFRRGHIKVVKLMVRHVNQFPSDQEINRYLQLLDNDKDLDKKCKSCKDIIFQAKERQAAEANKHASILLQEIDQERSREETRKAAAARRREKKRQKKKEKAEQLRARSGDSKENVGLNVSKKDPLNNSNSNTKSSKQNKTLANSHLNENNNNDTSSDDSSSSSDNDDDDSLILDGESLDLLEIAINRDILMTGGLVTKRPANLAKQQVQSRDEKSKAATAASAPKKKEKKQQPTPKKPEQQKVSQSQQQSTNNSHQLLKAMRVKTSDLKEATENHHQTTLNNSRSKQQQKHTSNNEHNTSQNNHDSSREDSRASSDNDDDDSLIEDGESSEAMDMSREMLLTCLSGNNNSSSKTRIAGIRSQMTAASKLKVQSPSSTTLKSSQQFLRDNKTKLKHKKVTVPASAISRVIGRGGSNINTVREVSCAHIEVEKQKGQADRGVIIKGTAEATRIATQLIYALINESNKDLNEVIKNLGLQKPTIGGGIASNSINPSKFMSATSSISSSSSSKSAYTNSSSLHQQQSNTIPSVGVWNNSTAANMFVSQITPTRSQSTPQQHRASAARSPVIGAPSYSVANNVPSPNYSLTNAINGLSINDYLQQHQLPIHSTVATAATASVTSVGQRQSQQPPQTQVAQPQQQPTGSQFVVPTSIADVAAVSEALASVAGLSDLQPGLVAYNLAHFDETAAASSTPEYSPFNNLFSKVAQTSVWQQNVATSTGQQKMQNNTVYNQSNEAQDPLQHLPNLKPIGTERKSILEQCMRNLSMMNLPPYNQ